MPLARQNLDLQISPIYSLRDLVDAGDTYEMRVNVFENRTKGWFFDHAKCLTESGGQHVGFAVLKILFSYFEMIAQYKTGQLSDGHAGDFFKTGILDVFPEIGIEARKDDILTHLWKSARNGLFHSGMTRDGIFLRDADRPIVFEAGKIYIDRFKFPESIYAHFEGYIAELRGTRDSDVIHYFNYVWEEVNGGKLYPISH